MIDTCLGGGFCKLTSCVIQPLGQGGYDVGGLMKLLKTIGYTGPVGFQGFGINTAPPPEVLRESMAVWRSFQP